MARRKDADKRQLILGEAKRMFADGGYDGTSMGGLAGRIGIPVGSLYTYFDSKEVLLNTIIEEGWNDFSRYLERGLSGGEGGLDREPPLSRLAFLVRRALPELFDDIDLIAILLAQADSGSRLGEKLEHMATLITSIIADYRKRGGEIVAMEIPTLRAGLAVMLLGSLESIRLIHRTGIDLAAGDVIAFLVSTVEGALGCSLPDVGERGA